MSPTIEDGDWLVVRSYPSYQASIRRGVCVIVQNPRNTREIFVKRVVGLPGETVKLADGMLWIGGNLVEELYLGGLPSAPGLIDASWTLSASECFVMGDNRTHSVDSREYGPVKSNMVLGSVVWRIWPLRRWGRLGC